MPVRNVSAIVFGVLEIAYFFAYVLLRYENRTELLQLTLYLNTATWIAFLTFAAYVFRPFSYRWLRVFIAFFVFMIVPATFSATVTKLLADADATRLWFELT